MKKIIKYICHPKDTLVCMMNKNFFFFVPDKIYLKWKYRLIIGKKLDLKNPKLLSEKLQWLKLYDRNPIYTKMVDKYEAREYIKDKAGEKYLIPLIGIYNTSDVIFERPKQLDEMIDIAKSLSKNIPCLRVDLYLCNDKIYIGELTFSHFAGFTKFEPKEYETILGNYIKIGGKRNEKK